MEFEVSSLNESNYKINPQKSSILMFISTKMSPIEYAKMILEKVSFEPKIFRKELRKALRKASKQDFKHLMDWCRERFGRKKKN